MKKLLQAWLQAKADERQAVEYRRKIEDELLEIMPVNLMVEGVQNIAAEGFKVKVTPRFNRKIDDAEVQRIARENDLFDHVEALFRYKPEINAKQWKLTDESITSMFADAITTTPGRPSFAVEEITEGE